MPIMQMRHSSSLTNLIATACRTAEAPDAEESCSVSERTVGNARNTLADEPLSQEIPVDDSKDLKQDAMAIKVNDFLRFADVA